MSINFQLDISNTPPRTIIGGEVTIFHAAELKERMLDILPDSEHWKIDLAQVTDFDGAGLQLLLWAKREAEQHGIEIQVYAPSQIVLDVLELVGLTHYFNISAETLADEPATEDGGNIA